MDKPARKTWSRKKRPAAERFWEKVDRNGPVPSHAPSLGNCWIWTASTAANGWYGQFSHEPRKLIGAHRWAWQSEHGQIPDGMDLDHLCRTSLCVRPSHLEPVPHRVNVLRGAGVAAYAARATHCRLGHPYSGNNLIVTKDGTRACRECRRRYQRINPDSSSVRRMTPEEAVEIRAAYAAGGVTQKELAERYGFGVTAVQKLVSGRTHRTG